MKVSLIIRTRNEDKNIGKCLDSLIQQSKQFDEILIIDNLSVDNTLKIVRKYKNLLPIKVINNPIIGFASGLQLGVEKAKYSYIAFISADCVANVDWLKNITDFIRLKKCAVVQGNELLRPLNDIHYVLNSELTNIKSGQIIYFNNTNTLYKKSTLCEFLPFKGVGRELYGEDTLMALEFHKKNYIAYLITNSYVKHSKFDNKEDFRYRVYIHAKSSVNLFLAHPLRPRIYLNSFYWIIREFIFFFIKHDKRFLKVSYWRFTATVKGTLNGIGLALVHRRFMEFKK